MIILEVEIIHWHIEKWLDIQQFEKCDTPIMNEEKFRKKIKTKIPYFLHH